MADAATLQARLDEAEAALHRLVTGSQVEELRLSAGEASRAGRYTPADVNELRAYIGDLRRQLGQPTRRRAIGVLFG
jgi:hypothetical protein